MKLHKTWSAVISMLVLSGLLFGVLTFNASGHNAEALDMAVQVSEPITPAVSVALRDIDRTDPEPLLNREEINPMRNPGLFSPDLGLTGSNTTKQDPLVALSQIHTGYTPDPIFTFEGLGTDGYTHPDTMGEVGPNHYVQMVNVSFAIYDKSGNVLVPDTEFTDLFAGSGLSSCSSQNDGDPVVLWDSMADRWLLSQFAVSSTPEHMCIAISTTNDPTGSYYLYEFEVPDFPDYFKFGVWEDAYYMGTNTGYPNQYYAYAFDREAMLAGDPATYQYSNGHPNFLLPADLDGSTPAAAGTPGMFYTMLAEGYPNHPSGVDRVVLYEFDVDWDTPANSTFGIAQEFAIEDYNYTTCGFFAGDCIPQPGTTQRLDAVDPWPMWRFAYRNLGAYEALVGNFTVDTNGSNHAGIRWFELQKTGADWELYQEGTHSPDSDHRWMGSIAMDGSGNIALGYSISSETTYPSLRYASRLRSDPLGTLQDEATLYAGGGSQTGPYDRWGDYSSMSVDPADECTFWYTGEYHDVDAESFYWNTRIGTFRLPECSGSLGPDFSVAADPAELAICAPDDAVYDLTLSYLSGFDAQVDLSVPYPPAGATVDLTPSSLITPTNASVFTLGTAAIAAGSYDIDIVGFSAPTLTHTTTVGLDLYTAVPVVPAPVAPADAATDVALMPTFEWSSAAQAQSYYLEVATDAAFTNVVYDVTVSGTSHTMTGANLDPDTPYYWRVSASNTCGDSATSSAYSFTTVLLFCGYPNAAIGDNATTYDALTSSLNQPLADLNVYVQITHTFIGDLDITLTHQESGSQVVLLPASFSCTGDDIDATFDDEAGAAITCGATAPALSGDVQPAGSLTDFDYDSMAGTWQIAVHDGASGDTGTLVEWCLSPQFTASVGAVAGTVTDANTSDPVAGVSVTVDDGVNTYTNLTNAAGEYVQAAAGGTYTVTASLEGYVTAEVFGVTVTDGVTTTQDFVLDAGELSSSANNFAETVALGEAVTTTWTLENVGTDALDFEIRYTDNGYNPALMAPASGSVLLVDGGDTDATNAFALALDELGYAYDTITDEDYVLLTVDDLLDYDAVIYAYYPNNDSEHNLTMAYLDAGGRFLVADNDFGFSQNSTELYQTYLQSNYVSDSGSDGIITGMDIMAGIDIDISADPFPDDFTAGAEGVGIFEAPSGNLAGIRVERNDYKAIYFAWDYDNMVDADETPVLDAALSWLTTTGPFWLSTDVVTGTLATGSSQAINVVMDASLVSLAGDYYADLVVENSTPYGDLVIPVTMTVGCADCGTLAGSITDAFTGSPVAASVHITSTAGFDYLFEDVTTYSIAVPPETYYLTASAPDYYEEAATSVITVNAVDTVDFALRFAQPRVSITPAAFDVTTSLGSLLTYTLDLQNTGFVSTTFELREKEGGFVPPVVVQSNVADVITARQLPALTTAELTETGVEGKDTVIGPASGGLKPDEIGDNWETMAALPAARAFSAVIADQAGYVYVMGGTSDADGSVPTDTNYRYDTSADTWATMAVVPAVMDSADGVLINDKIYIPGDAATATTYVYDIATDTWASIATNGGYTARSQYQVVAMGTDLYVLGGIIAADSASTTEVWVLDTTTETWSAGVPMQKSRTSFSAAVVDGEILVAGGVLYPGFTPDMTAEKFNGTSWSYIADVPDGGGAYTRWSYNADGQTEYGLWLAAGRRDADWNVLNHASYYDPALDTWTDSPTIPTLAQSRVYMEGAVAADGYFYVIGGRNSAADVIYDTNERLYVGSLELDDVLWLSEDPTTGELDVNVNGGQQEIAVVFDTTGLTELGTYYATIQVLTDDPAHPYVDIPVTLEVVTPTYGIELSPEADSLAGAPGSVVTYTVWMTNTGNVVDSYDMSADAHNWSMSMPDHMELMDPGASHMMEVAITIPDTAAEGDSDSVMITVVSQHDPSVTASFTLTTTALIPDYTIYLPLVFK